MDKSRNLAIKQIRRTKKVRKYQPNEKNSVIADVNFFDLVRNFCFCVCFALLFGEFSPQIFAQWSSPVNISGLNSEKDDFAPAISPDGTFYFNSERGGWSQFFTSHFDKFGVFSAPEFVHGALNKPHSNQSYIAFSPTEIYFSTFRQTERRPLLNLFSIAKQGNIWSNPSPIESLNEDAFSAHPAFSPSGKLLVFSSNRAGGKGGTDLWITSKNPNGIWEKPVTMGDILNSSGNEITPFFASEDSLYFASDGFGGKGGDEIFLTVRTNGVWQSPVPLTELNSEADDSDFMILPDGTAIFASNRAGGKGGLDLYSSGKIRANVQQQIQQVEFTISAKTQAITVEEFFSTESFPILPYIFFDENSATLPQNLHQLKSEAISGFAISKNIRNSLEMYADLLNILGKRLREFPKATLTITGCANEATTEETPKLARRRAEIAQQYLSEIWGIDKTRLHITAHGLPTNPSNMSTPEGKEENRRVELQASEPLIFAPLKLEEVSTKIQPPQLDISLDARPRGMVRRWNFRLITEKSDSIYAETGTILPRQISLSPENFPLLKSNNEAHLEIYGADSLGRITRNSLVLPVSHITVKQKRDKNLPDKVLERFSLVLFEFNQAKLTDEHRSLLREVAKSITPKATVVVSGYTDMLGDETHNARLAEERAKSVAEELRRLMPTVNIIIEAIGSSNLFDNATPFGRFYSRTVQITIEK